jgi:hypothetical protein
MISREIIYEAMCQNPSTKFILAGDVDEEKWFQCRSGKGSEYNEIFTKGYLHDLIEICNDNIQKYDAIFKNENLNNEVTGLVPVGQLYKWSHYRTSRLLDDNDTLVFNYVNFEIDRRAKDDELKDMKLFVRNCMDEVFTDGGIEDTYKISKMLKQKYKTISFENAMKEFKDGNIFIAGTHVTNHLLLENNISSGYITNEKELIFDITNIPEKCIKRGSFTTHSFQGFTIEDKKVFIVLDLFEYAMLYTSISRCVNFNQIVLVDKPQNNNYTEMKNKLKEVNEQTKKEKEEIETKKKSKKNKIE